MTTATITPLHLERTITIRRYAYGLRDLTSALRAADIPDSAWIVMVECGFEDVRITLRWETAATS
jgi:hypothetical protein